MAFTLRWSVLCVWLHTNSSSCSSACSSARSRDSPLGLGIVCISSDAARPISGRGHPRRRRNGSGSSRVADHGSLEDRALDSSSVSSSSSSSSNESDDVAEKINAFSFSGCCKDGSLVSVEVIKPKHSKATLEVLTDSFCDLLWGPLTYRPLLKMIVQENLVETQRLFPKNVVLVAVYHDQQKMTSIVVGTVEVYLRSAGVSNPRPPPHSPYLCNMAVKLDYRRKGVGWQLLKAAEELARAMGCKEMYLHCRLIDKVPMDIYQRAGYEVVTTSSIFSWLFLQRRKHLMRKDIQYSDNETV